MEQNIIIVDNFYQNPDQIRKIALEEEYPDPENGYTYPGKNSKGSYYNDKIHQKFEKLVNCKLDPADKNGYFRVSLENDTHLQDVHVDPSWDWGAVIYLSDPKDCVDEGGTSFWRHNTLNLEMCPKTDEEARHYGYPSYSEAWWTTVYGDGQDRSKWTRYMLSPMKYNRLSLFKTFLWHSHNYNFGTNLNNGRLVQLFFFREIIKNQ
jgi:hypothetical protein